MRKIYCSKCHEATFEGNAFCPYCGTPFHSIPELGIINNKWPEDRIEDYLVTDMAQYIGNNRETYFKKFMKIANKKLTFHWPAFFLSIYWFLYRRMVKETVIIYICMFFYNALISIPIFVLMFNQRLMEMVIYSYVTVPLSLLPSIIIGMIANPLYYKKVKRDLTKLNCENRPAYQDFNLQTELKKMGGTKLANPFIMIGISMGVGIIIYIIILLIFVPNIIMAM